MERSAYDLFDDRIAQIEPLIEPFFKGVMLDTEPLFISNESTIWDFDLGIAEDIQHRCSVFAGRPVELHELSLPLWQLIPRISPKADPRRPADSDLKVDP